MSSPVRRNSSKPFIDFRLKREKGISDNGDIPNVMTSPAIFPIGSSDTDHSLKDIGEEDSSFSASSVSDVAKPPDGGWGWAVVFASFMIHVLGKSKCFKVCADLFCYFYVFTYVY